jgi:hypothetical protein
LTFNRRIMLQSRNCSFAICTTVVRNPYTSVLILRTNLDATQEIAFCLR